MPQARSVSVSLRRYTCTPRARPTAYSTPMRRKKKGIATPMGLRAIDRSVSCSPMDFATADLCDEHPEVEVLELPLLAFGAHRRFAGPASTIAAFEDNSRVREAVAERGHGRVLVIDGGGSRRRAMLGDRLARQAAANGWAGVLIHGCLRDADAIDAMPIGVRALGTCPRKTDKRGLGDRDVVVRFGGISIAPGMWIHADRDGVLVSAGPLVPAAH